MGESRTHGQLVASIVSWVQETCGVAPGIVLVDSGVTLAGSRPPAIDGYVPDVYVSRPGCAGFVVGEAKTARDLERPHSQAQLMAFLAWCACYEGSVLAVAVPWHMTRAARNMVSFLQRKTQTDSVKIVILDQIAGREVASVTWNTSKSRYGAKS